MPLVITSRALAGDAFGADNIEFSTGSVPVPAAVWLFGTAIIGMLGFKRRKITT